MKSKTILMLIAALFLLPAISMAQEPLGIAEEGSPEAERLRRAHEADVLDAMESPAEAERRNRRMRGEGGSSGTAVTPTPRPEPHYTPPPPAPSSSSGGESDLQLESAGAASRRNARMQGGSAQVSTRPSPRRSSTPTYTGSNGSDLAVGGNEPVWLGGTRVSTARRRALPMRASVVVDADKSQIKTPPFLFNAWSTNLSDGDRRILEKVASMMKEKPNEVPKVQVAAFTDNSGDSAINEALTIARANVVKAYLILQGIGVHRLVAKGYGDSNPIESNETKAGRAKNRRIEFKIIK